MTRHYAVATHGKSFDLNCPKANKRRNLHSISIYKVTGDASAAKASGFLLVTLSGVPRPFTILLQPKSPRLGRVTPDQG